ncbi:MAG: L,D-transpeptidase family protein [Pseudomonadota bacterium]
MPSRRFLLGSFAGLCVAGPSWSRTPDVTRILVEKRARKMTLFAGRQTVRSYRIDLGFAPRGTKRRFGDGRTPEGAYYIDRRNPNSAFHLSLGINYPNRDEMRKARAAGIDPGGDIFIHGEPNSAVPPSHPDWTAGCIAVTNREMEEIWGLVPLGTLIDITA